MERKVFPADLKGCFAERKPLIGTFVKNTTQEQIEVLGSSGLDLAVLDAEHAPFDRRSLDACILAAKYVQIPTLVRIPALDPAAVLQALDMGADGVLVPHVRNHAAALELAKMSHYGAGGRGFAGTTRAAGYGHKGIARHLREAKQRTVVIGQIEDVEALDQLDDIFSVPGIDGYLIGRVDLTVALEAESPNAPVVAEAVEAICASALKNKMPLGMFISDLTEVDHWMSKGMSFFLAASDHAFVYQGASVLGERFSELVNGSD